MVCLSDLATKEAETCGGLVRTTQAESDRALHLGNKDLFLKKKTVIYVPVLMLMADEDGSSSPAVVFDDIHVLIKDGV